MQSKILFYIIAIFFVFLNNTLWATWVRAPQEATLSANLSFFQAKQYYTDNTMKINTSLLREINLSLYGEYGLTSYWTAGFYVPFKFMQSSNSVNSSTIVSELYAFGDIGLIQKFQFLQLYGFLMSFVLEAGLPTGKSNDAQTNQLVTGYGQTRLSPNLAVAYGLGRFYTNLHFGFTKSFGNFSDEIFWGVLLGISIVKNLLKFEVDFKVQHSLRNGERPNSGIISNPNFRLFSNDIEYYSYRFNLVYKIKKNMGIFLDFKSAFLVKNYYSGLVYSLGYYIVL